MRKILFFALVGLAVMLVACDNTEKEVKEFLGQFSEAATSGDKDALAKLYPGIEIADSLSFGVDVENLKIENTDEENVFKVTLEAGKDILVTRNDDGTMTITESHGLFAYDASRLDFARKTGQFKDELTDITNAQRMSDSRFLNELSEKLFAEVRNNISVQVMSQQGREYWEVIWSAVVTNNNDFDLGGDDYSAYLSCTYFDREMLRDVSANGKTLSGKSIPAHASVTYNLGLDDMESGTQYRVSSINIKSLSPDVISRIYTPTGNEYEEFVKENGPYNPDTEPAK